MKRDFAEYKRLRVGQWLKMGDLALNKSCDQQEWFDYAIESWATGFKVEKQDVNYYYRKIKQ